MWQFVAFPVLGVVVCLLWWWLDPNERRNRAFKKELAAREPVADNEMISRYFAVEEEVANVPGEVRWMFAKHAGYPAEKLLPDDDLNFVWAGDLDMGDLVKELESGFGITIRQADVERMPCTIRAFSMLVADKTRRNNPCS